MLFEMHNFGSLSSMELFPFVSARTRSPARLSRLPRHVVLQYQQPLDFVLIQRRAK